jgi:CHAT domain-containing protein/Flp pilus assembly protein TadD
MIRPHSRFAQGKYRSWLVYCGLALSVGLSLIQIQASPNAFYIGKEVKPFAGTVNPAQENQHIPQLEPGNPIERELTGGQSHSYRMALAAGQYVKLAVEQRGIDVAVKLFGPDGKQIIEFDSEARLQEQETVEWMAEEAGSYRLDVLAKLKNAATGRYEIPEVELRPATENDRDLHEANKLFTEFVRLFHAGQYDEALPLVERVQEIRERALGQESPQVARALNALAVIYQFKGDYAKAEPFYLRALAIREKVLGPEHPDVAITLGNLANFYGITGRYEEAEPHYLRSLSIMEKALGPKHPDVALGLNDLATLYNDRGDYVNAELFYQRALTLNEEALGREHPDVALSLNNLAILYEVRGDHAKAESFFLRAMTTREKALGPEHPLVAATLLTLASFYTKKDNSVKAEQLYQRALIIHKKSLGPEHPYVGISLFELADIYRNRGDYVKAEPLYLHALLILEKALGTEHPFVAEALSGLATLYRKRGDYAKAEPLYLRVLTIREQLQGPEHPGVADSLINLAAFYAAKGDIAQAITFLSRANAVEERNFVRNLTTGSERQKLAYLATFSAGTDFTLSLQSQAAPNDPRARDLAFTTLLCRKGRGLDAMTDTIATLRRHATPQDQMLFNKLIDARAQLAALTLKGPDEDKPDTYRTRLEPLKEKVEKLEEELSARSTEFRKQSQPVTLTAVQAALPAGSALIEFALFTPVETQTEKSKPPRYLAYLLPAQGQPKWADLGEAATIDRAVDTWRKALRNPSRTDVKRLARAVDEKVMRPVRSLLSEIPGGTRRLLISPDGSLNLIPFAALVDEQNQYLVERYSISYLTSGRDLLRLQIPQPSNAPPLVVANPDFGRPTTIAMRRGQNSSKSRTHTRARAQIDPTPFFFQPLLATEDEALAIKALLPQATVLQREAATEVALKQARGPQVLHIATHGFFIDYQEPAPEKDDPQQIAAPINTGFAPGKTTSYTVQLEAIPSLETAREKIKQLKAQGVDAYIVRGKVKGKGIFFRVRVGNFPAQAEANRYGSELQERDVLSQFFVARYQPPQRGLIEPSPTITAAPAKPADSQPFTEPPSHLRLSKLAAQVKDPLLRSGLALAGANHRKSGDDDGILTAMEAAYLDLSGTKLAVLSACDTGVGELKNGEGVQGLRRALILAGSESQVMSLWPVSDEATKDMMTLYYKALQQGEERSEGLRQVQLRMLRERKDRRHPFYWAAFIQSGEWASLDRQK